MAALTRENRLACEVSLETGLRIGDVLRLKSCELAPRFEIREQKTGKKRRVALPDKLLERLQRIAGETFVFEGRLDRTKHRTTTAVLNDIKRAAKLFRIKLNITPHTCRKVFAVEEFRRCRNIAKVQRLLNHTYESTTLLYALADQLTTRRKGAKIKRG